MSPRRLAAALLAAAALAAPAPAGAAPTTIASWGQGAGRVNNPVGVAVDQTGAGGVQAGTLYVADRNNVRIDRFGPAGDFQLAWGAGVADGTSGALQVCGPAVEVKRCFKGNHAGSAGEVFPAAVAVEPSTGDVYVAEGQRRLVSRYTADGTLVYSLGPDVALSGPGNTGSEATQTLTVKATAGTFALSLRAPVPFGESTSAQTTAPIPYDASHEALQEALEALPNVGAGDLTVTGGPGDATGSAPYEVHFSGGPYAHNVVPPIDTDAGGLVGPQTIVVQGATGGTFELIAEGKTTAPIPYDATAAEVQAKLAGLAAIGAGNVSVEGAAGGPWTVTYTGALAGEPGPLLGASREGHDEQHGLNYGLEPKTGPSAATISVIHPASAEVTVPGGGPEVCEPSRGDTCKEAAGPGTVPGEFTSPASLAFDSAGRLWVNDRGERAQRFDPAGSFIEEVPLPAGSEPRSLAIDPSSDDLYVLGPRGHNEEQRIHFPEEEGGGAARFEGEYELEFEGETVGPFYASNANAAARRETEERAGEVQAALEALPAIGAGNVSVEARSTYGGDYFVTFIHGLRARDVPQLVPTTLSGFKPVTVKTLSQGAHGSVRRLDSTDGHLIKAFDDEDGDLPQALATDAAGNLYVSDGAFGAPYRLQRYDDEGNLESVFGAGQVIGSPQGNALALDAGSEAPGEEREAALYAASSDGVEPALATPETKAKAAVQRFPLPAPGPLPSAARAEGVLPTEATLAAQLNPEGHATHYRFQYLTEAAYEEHGFEECGLPANPDCAQSAEEELPGGGYEEEAVSAQVEGLIPATAYRFRIVAENANGETEAESAFTTPTAVGVEAQWASAVAAHDATLNARLDPLGPEAEWWLEYDTSPYGQGEAPHGTSLPLPHGSLKAGFGALPVAQALNGLAPATTYHYRFAAADSRPTCEAGRCAVYGPGQSFTTQPAGLGFTLPDSRAWEMVSPPDKHGGRIAAAEPATGGQVQAASDGEALAYLSYGSLEAAPEGNRLIEQSSELARREAGGRWATADITPPYAEAAPVSGNSQVYKLFSTDLERALLEPHAPADLPPYASEETPYLRENTRPPAYAPLAGGCPPEVKACGGGLQVRGASPDLRHVVVRSEAPLAAGAAEGSLYEWSGGALSPLSVPPAGEEGGGVVGGELGAGEVSTRGAVSGDGSRVFWSKGGTPPFSGLYVRDASRGGTVRLDTVSPGAFGTGKVDPRFQGASSDGSLAFFTDTQNLTGDANEEGADLYRWTEPGTHGCAAEGGCLQDLSAGVAGPGESAEVLGVLPGFARDGSRAYLIARGVLDEEPNAHGEAAAPGQPNLYTWSAGEGTRFIAGLAGADSWDWGSPTTIGASAYALSAATSPSGRYLAFMSERPLSGYENAVATSPEPCGEGHPEAICAQEVFRYDAQTGALACVSCNPSGARPLALAPGAGQLPAEFDFQDLWKGTPVAAAVPEAPALEFNLRLSPYAPRYVHDDGRVFFDAADSLVPADSNGNADVYEYEPFAGAAGTAPSDDCTAASAGAGTAVVPGGCVSLVSSGRAADGASFLDASAGAGDVFFYSAARLSVNDVDSELDVYDARVGGEPATLSPSAECQGEACQPPAAAPAAQTPSSAAFRGPGNLREAAKPRCPKGKREVKRHGKTRCVNKRAHKRHHKHHKRHHRRAHR